MRILSTRILHDGWSQLKAVTLSLARDGHPVAEVHREVIDHGHGAAVLAYDVARGVVLLVRQWRAAAVVGGWDQPLLEACAGKLEGDEPEACIRREAVEELGYRLETIEQVGFFFSTPAVDQEKIHTFIAPYTPADRVAAGGGLAEEGEDIEVVEMGFGEAFALIASGGIVDAKTIILLQHLKLTGRMG